ncbi:MAG: ATP-dependent helicase [Bdellovibrionales bacterium]
MTLESITDGLNPSQKEAVLSTKPALIVLAGAGSGKTRVLTRRITHLLAKGFISPTEFLAVTFTNKASHEMKDRIIELLFELGFPPPPEMWVSTFHSMGAKILREHIHLLDYPTSFTIYDGDDQIKVIKSILKELNINDKSVNPKIVRESISNAKGRCIYSHETEKLEEFWIVKFQEIYALYEKKLFESKALDFSDLLFKTYDLLLSYPAVLEVYQNQFKHILVDEYQDTNALQYKLIRLLAGEKNNIFAVGDEDQSIYSWRGADVQNIQLMEKDFSAQKIKLEINYRSTKNIVEASNALIQNNTIRNEKTLTTDNPYGDKIKANEATNDYDEAKIVASGIETLIAEGADPSSIAIFYRLNSQSRVLEEQLRMRSIAYKILGGLRFYERKEIKDMLAFMKLAVNPDDEVSLLRVINVPTRGIGKKTIETLVEYARQHDINLFSTLKALKTEPILKPGPKKKVLDFLRILEGLIEIKDKPATDVYREALDLTGYVLNLKAENNSEADARIDNLEELDNALSHFEKERGDEATLLQFLEETALISDIDSADFDVPQVTLMTLHVSKGLEFDNVFVVGLEEGLLPCVHGEEVNQDLMAVEEERRLMYVGMTRAKEKLHLSFAKSRKVWGQEQFYPQSRFIKEIPDEYMDKKLLFSPSRSSSSGWKSSQYSNSYKSNQTEDPFPDYESGLDDGFFDDEDSGLRKGHKVRHPIFGAGSVLETEGSGDLMKVKIVFSDRSVKKFVAKYARLERI